MSLYHSALKSQVWEGPGCDRFNLGQSVAFVHNVFEHLPTDEYSKCDILYMEPPWPSGYGVFNRRAHVEEGRTYGELMRRIGTIISSVSIPVALLIGKKAAACLPQPDYVRETRLNGGKAWLAGYRLQVDDTRSSRTILRELAERFNCVGDPFCGYGYSGQAFREQGKDFVLSDHNPKCIGYIAEHAEGWGR